MELDFSFLLLSILVFIAGFIDSIAGGGGLITIPAYINYKLPTEYLLGTNKLSSSSGTLIATLKYLSELKFKKIYLIKIFISSFVFSFSGAFFISKIPNYLLKIIIFFLIPTISFYLIKKKDFAITDTSGNLSEKHLNTRSIIIASVISFYDGILGPGTGTFLAVSYSKFIGYDILKSTALAKFTNLVSNISALSAFIILGKVNFKLGIFMGIISLIGNYLGSHFALKKGADIIKPFIIIVSNLILLKTILDFIK